MLPPSLVGSPYEDLGPETLTSATLNRVTGISSEVPRVPRVFIDYAQISIPRGPVNFINPGERTTKPISNSKDHQTTPGWLYITDCHLSSPSSDPESRLNSLLQTGCTTLQSAPRGKFCFPLPDTLTLFDIKDRSSDIWTGYLKHHL